MAGESGGHMIPGFDLGNSPLDFKEKLVRGREIVMKTTNGTSAALHSKGARKIVAASFLNLARVIEEIKKESGSVVIQCAGSGGAFSMEDVLLAGAAASAFEDRLLDDASRAAVFLFRSAKLPLDQFLIDNCDHAKKLFSIGYFEDVVFCAKINMYDLLPVWRENGFVRG
ncbi:MAG: 2-phosphosulfolactate phosphatase [Thermotogaceae bacterium]|nr:2-phosphosulfolactate phosphatase [Thermotogaceae bacterium]